MIKRSLILLQISLVLLMLSALLSAGCIERQISEEMFFSKVTSAFESLQTYWIETDITMSMNSDSPGSIFSMGISYRTRGIVDLEQHKMKTATAMNIPGTDTMEAEGYLIDNMMYIKTNDPTAPFEWFKQEVPGEFWEQVSSGNQQTRFLELSDFEVVGWEKANGTNCIVVEIVPNEEIMRETVELTGIFDSNYSGLMDKMVQDMTVRQWYDEETCLPVKETAEMLLHLDPEVLGEIDPELNDPDVLPIELTFNVSMETNTSYSHINKPVSIELPPEALGAVEL